MVCYFKFDCYVVGVIGVGFVEIDMKIDLVVYVFVVVNVDSSDVVMVGDCFYDVIGVIENGVLLVGVFWGYGFEEEFRFVGCIYFVKLFDDFCVGYVEMKIGFVDFNFIVFVG